MKPFHWTSVGPNDASDEVLMRWAEERGFVVLTSDLDFSAILAATRGRRPSVIQLRSDHLSPSEIGPSVLAGLTQAATELDAGAIVSIDLAKARVRILPLHD